METLEIFIKSDSISAFDWQRLVEKIRKYDKDISLEISFQYNNVEFYLHSRKNISSISTQSDGFILKPSPVNSMEDFSGHRRVYFRLPSNKNILEVRESEEIKRQRVIENIRIDLKSILNFKVYKVTIVLKNQFGDRLISTYLTAKNPLDNLEIDFKNNLKIKKKEVPLFLKTDEAAQLFSSQENNFLEVNAFPKFSQPVYFSLDKFEFGKHSLIVGQTGVGKSKFLELFVKNLAKLDQSSEYAIVVVDPHASLYPQFDGLKANKVNLDFLNSSCNLFPTSSEPKIATELTILLFKTILKDQFNAKMERVLKYVIYLLFLTSQMSLVSLKRFLTELEFRKSILNTLGDQYSYISHFFETEFTELQTKFYEIAIMPALVLVDELSFIPAFSSNTPNNLEEILKSNFLTNFSLNRIFLGEKATVLIAGLIIQQLFLIAQKGSLNKKIILIIDEVSVIENESLISILSEARKYNLSLFLSQQYLTQISPALLKAILSNVYNYFTFKVSDEDAKILLKNLDISFPDETLIEQKEKGLTDEDLKRNLLVTLNPRECLVRAFANGKFYPCFKAKTTEVI
ncbi:ATP-binding protein [Candidatus Daviesbacteria bacterium]|nr:ATP-binding protein [Candidatus Daviesbacteria bacterium]